jgi:hypothetical protein
VKSGGPLPRYTPLLSTTPLQRGGPLERHAPLHGGGRLPQRRSQPRRRQRGIVEQDWLTVVRPMAWLRCLGLCEWCGLRLEPNDWDCHHRQLRSRGGPDHITNAAALHVLCHVASGPDGVHREEKHHRDRGFMLRSGDDPEAAPLWLPGGRRVLLTANGQYVDMP